MGCCLEEDRDHKDLDEEKGKGSYSSAIFLFYI